MMLTLLLGAARSGKSALALAMAGAQLGPVNFIATAEALDEEMVERIAAHRDERPAHWATIEEPVEVAQALAAMPDSETAVLDCLTLWVSNLMSAGWAESAVIDAAADLASLAAARPGRLITVSNEVGWGIVPADPVTRRYRDLLGGVNKAFAARADEALLVVAGLVLPLQAYSTGRPHHQGIGA